MLIGNYIVLGIHKIIPALILILVVTFGLNVFATAPDWPKKVSELNGWRGLELEKGKRCPPCYSLIIPPEFGLHSNENFLVLINLPGKRISDDMEYDLDGPFFIDDDVLDHLLELALREQFVKAAKVILNPEKHGLMLGIETSEDLVGERIVPLLRGYRNLNKFINKTEYDRIGKLISHWSAGKRDFRVADKLVQELNSRKYNELAKTIYRITKREKDFMKKHGEKYLGVQ